MVIEAELAVWFERVVHLVRQGGLVPEHYIGRYICTLEESLFIKMCISMYRWTPSRQPIYSVLKRVQRVVR